MSLLDQPITATWRTDMTMAREAFLGGDRQFGFIYLGRAAAARRWIADDLRGIRAAQERVARIRQLVTLRKKVAKQRTKLMASYAKRLRALDDRLLAIEAERARL